MKRYLITILILAFLTSCGTKVGQLSIIPKPVKVEAGNGFFSLSSDTKLIAPSDDEGINKVAEYLTDRLKFVGIELQKSDAAKYNVIELKIEDGYKTEGEYKLSVSEEKSVISAANSQGLFYGVQTLIQMMPVEVYSSNQQSFSGFQIPTAEIHDFPRFQYRGMHLDVCRHFFPTEFVKKYIDLLAMHKMNKFHFHLTEDQGWRIEIKKYPKLTEIGGWRKETMGDGKKYGGFYTQEQIKEIVQYAADRFITVIPEIEMPGHSSAALAAYPEFACTDGPFNVETSWGVFPDIYCAGKDETFSFLENIMAEVLELFPSEYIHVGGDEAPKERWKECSDCQARIKNEKLKDEHELQSYFITRMEKYLNANGRKLIGWDEILEGGLAPDATVMSWRGEKGGIEAAKQNHDVVMTPGTHVYFDHYQSSADNEPLAIGGYSPLSKVYSYNPLPEELEAEKHKFILGAQANVWTEYIPTTKHVEYMMTPRIAALSEAIWSDFEQKDFNNFLERLKVQFDRYEEFNVNYSTSLMHTDVRAKYNEDEGDITVELFNEVDKEKIYYTLDGTAPGLNSMKYSGPFNIDKSTTIKARFINEMGEGKLITKHIEISKSFNKSVEYMSDPSEYYSGGGLKGLINGVRGSKNIHDGNWQGFARKNAEAVVDLGNVTEISEIKTGYIQRMVSHIFMPVSVKYFVSEDGKDFKLIADLKNEVSPKIGDVVVQDFTKSGLNEKARFVKVIAENMGVCPDWHPKSGKTAWVMIDEIIVN